MNRHTVQMEADRTLNIQLPPVTENGSTESKVKPHIPQNNLHESNRHVHVGLTPGQESVLNINAYIHVYFRWVLGSGV